MPPPKATAPPWHQPASLRAGLPPEPAPWVDRVAAAIRSSGSIRGAAAELGVVERTLWRWVLALRDDPAWGPKIPETPRGPHRWKEREGEG